MIFLLDTNACIQFLNGHSGNIKRNFFDHNYSQMAICSVVKAELFFGAMKSSKPKEYLEKISNFINRFHSFPFNDSASKEYGKIRASLEKRGKPIGPNDLLIASIAKVNDLTLITHNIREFARIEDLNLVDWEI